MKQLRVFLAFALTTGLATISQGQFGGKTTSAVTATPLVTALLPGIDDPGVVADLKLSQQQLAALVARRQAQWDETYTTAPKNLPSAKARLEETDALFKKTLSADQYKRAEQLAAQHVIKEARNPKGLPTTTTLALSPVLFRRYPEFVVAFKLTDEQKQKVTTTAKGGIGGGFANSLGITPEQIAAASAFYAPPLAGDWTAKTDARMIGRRLTPPRDLVLLDSKDVRADVTLTDEQLKSLTALRAKWTALNGDAGDRKGGGGLGNGLGGGVTIRADISPKEVDEQAAALRIETDQGIAATLAPNQLKRLRQIVFQDAHRGRHIEQLYRSPDVAAALAITEEQAKQIDAAREWYLVEATKAFDAGESYAATSKRVLDLAQARRDKGAAVLTTEQGAKLKALMGEPFVGSFLSDTARKGSRFGEGDSPAAAQFREAIFGQYSTEFTQLTANKSIQQELKLTAEQINRCYEARDKVPSTTAGRDPSSAKTYADRSKFIETELGKILTNDQAARFRQIMMQAREQAPLGFEKTTAVVSAVAYPGAAEAVKLTPEQRKALLAGALAKEVLTAEQKTLLERLMGEPFQGEFSTAKTTTKESAFPISPIITLLVGKTTGPGVEAELKLTPEQSKRLTAARTAYQSALSAALDNGGKFGSVSVAVRKAESEKFEKETAAILTPDQGKRLGQLIVQYAAAKSLLAALTAPDRAKLLGLTPEQTEKLTVLSEEAESLQRLRAAELVSDPEQKLQIRLRDAAEARMLAALTAEQRARWREMTGEPWAGVPRSISPLFAPKGL